MKKTLSPTFNVLGCLFLAVLLTSCSKIGFLNDNNSWLPYDLSSFGDFLKAYLVVQISIFVISFLVSFLLGNWAYVLVLFLHWVWLVNYRDYGFWKILLLFFFFTFFTAILRMLLKVIFDK